MNRADAIPGITVSDWVKELGRLYLAALKGKQPLKNIPAPMLWGPPGVGKSAGVRQLAEELEKGTGKHVEVTEIRLLLFSPIDLRGIPVADKENMLARWLKPEIFHMDDSDRCLNILFLDELTAAPPAVQAAAYQLTLDRRIGEHQLPDNCIVIGAGNRTTDRSVAYRMPNALANRMQHYEVIADFDSWKQWAMQHQVHPLVLGYLSFDGSKFCEEEPDAEQAAFTSPRSWMFVSDMLNMMGGDDVEELYNPISACVGTDTALSFTAWCRNHSDLPAVEDIFQGKHSGYPSRPDALYALVVSLANYAQVHAARGGKEELTMTELENMAAYVSRFPADYRTSLYSRLSRMEAVKLKLMRLPEFREWVKQI